MNSVQIIFGILLLSVGGESLIRGALGVAKKLSVSPLLSGIFIIGFGTSAPELSVSVEASLSGADDIAIGNVIGSNIGNILLILGLCALIRPLTMHKKALQRDASCAMAAALLCCVLMIYNVLNVWSAILLLGSLFAYLIWVYQTEKTIGIPSAVMHVSEAEEVQQVPTNSLMLILYMFLGLGMMIGGSHLLLNGAVSLAVSFGVSEAVVGLTVVAIGTSIPELSISIIAVVRKHVDVAIGNVLGSNIFNILGVLGVSALFQPLVPSPRVIQYDIWFMLVCTMLLLVLLWTTKKINRIAGCLMLLMYCVYTYVGFLWF